MKNTERWNDTEEALRVALEGLQARIWTSLPCIIVSWDANGNTCVIKPAIQGKQRNQDGSYSPVQIKQIGDVPIIWPQGGGFTLTFPLVAGAEIVALFSCRCIDNWHMLGGVQPEAELRTHSISDGFCLPGVRSRPNYIQNVSRTSTQLRSDDGSTYVEVAAGQLVNVVAPGGFTCLAPNFSVTAGGVVTATGEGTFNGHTVGHHTHTQGNDSGGNIEVPVNPPTG